MSTQSKIIKYIKKPMLIVPFLGARGAFKWLSDKTYLRLIYRIHFGKKLNIDNPQTFNEKLQYLKLHDRNPLYTQLADKYAVREYIAGTIGEKYLIPLLGVWDKFDEIDFSKLPNQFVLKCTHDSGSVVICKDKNTFDIKVARKKINKHLKRDYYWFGREWQYKDIIPRIIAEKYMEDETGELKDYKFFCFEGIPKSFFIATERYRHETKFDFFDMDFNRLGLKQHYPTNESYEFSKPKNLNLLVHLSECLTLGFLHCRVDFYSINEKVYFGEMTFHHFSGFESFEPETWDCVFGKWINLPIKKIRRGKKI